MCYYNSTLLINKLMHIRPSVATYDDFNFCLIEIILNRFVKIGSLSAIPGVSYNGKYIQNLVDNQ